MRKKWIEGEGRGGEGGRGKEREGKGGAEGEVGVSNEGKGSQSFAFCRLGQFKKSFVYPGKAPQGSRLMVCTALWTPAACPPPYLPHLVLYFLSNLSYPNLFAPPSQTDSL